MDTDTDAKGAARRTRANTINAGAEAARKARHRSENPHDVDSDAWIDWSEGFDQQTAWLKAGRGTYHVSLGTALVPRDERG